MRSASSRASSIFLINVGGDEHAVALIEKALRGAAARTAPTRTSSPETAGCAGIWLLPAMRNSSSASKPSSDPESSQRGCRPVFRPALRRRARRTPSSGSAITRAPSERGCRCGFHGYFDSNRRISMYRSSIGSAAMSAASDGISAPARVSAPRASSVHRASSWASSRASRAICVGCT